MLQKGTEAAPTATLPHYRRGFFRPQTQEIPPKSPPGGFLVSSPRLPAMLTATLPISVALLATATIRLLFLLPGLMLFAALLSALAVHVASPRTMTAKGPGDEAFGPKLDVYDWPGDP